MKSILKEAQMLHIKDYKALDPNDIIDFTSFRRIIDSQNYFCVLEKHGKIYDIIEFLNKF